MSITSEQFAGGLPCRDCLHDVDHCHGTLIAHPFHRAECTEPDCREPSTSRHALVVDCVAVQCDCDTLIALTG